LQQTTDFLRPGEEQCCAFCAIPKFLFEEEPYCGLGVTPKILYSKLLELLGLSSGNGWIDEMGAYVRYKQSEACLLLNCSANSATAAFKELREVGLISRTRDGQGKIDRIHLDAAAHSSDPQGGNGIPPDSGGKLAFKLCQSYHLPKILLGPRYPNYKMSNDAKAVYALFWDLLRRSEKKGLVDEENRFFVSPFINDLQRFLACGRDKASRVIKELEGEGLIERRESKGAPWRIYPLPLKIGDPHRHSGI
jgi:DNA-binding MarR family transcriptional regulator